MVEEPIVRSVRKKNQIQPSETKIVNIVKYKKIYC